MSRPTLASSFVGLLVIAACGRGDDPSKLVTRDSSGVAIVAYPTTAWDSAPAWGLTEKPLTVLGGDSADATMDLSSVVAGALLPEKRTVVSTRNPLEVLLFNGEGAREARLGAPGDHAGEFQSISLLFPLGADSLFAFDALQMKGLFFANNGMPLGERRLPGISSPVPLSLKGRMKDGTFVFTVDMVTDSAPGGPPKAFRNRYLVLGLNPRNDHYDTLAVSRGAEVISSTLMVGGQAVPISRPLIFGASTQVAVGGGVWYLSAADRLEVETHDHTGKLLRVVRIPQTARPVAAADQEKYKSTVREALDRLKATMPQALILSEMKKLEEASFADHLPAIAQMMTDDGGNLWVNRGFSLLDKVRSWVVFNPEGQIVGRLDTPIGSVLAISGDRMLIRREDAATRKVGLEVYGLTRTASPGAKADSPKP